MDDNNSVALEVRCFAIDPNPDAEKDEELVVSSVEIENGTMWVYVKKSQ